VFNFLKKKKKELISPLRVDIHSHLLPGLDDGVKTLQQAGEVIRHLHSLGYRKLITTPHVIQDIYRNTPEIISSAHRQLVDYLKQNQMEVEILAAAEYYLDETLVASLEANETLLTIPGKYLLFETNFLNEPLNLKQFIFLASSKGYKVVLAHPERYIYLNNDLKKVKDLMDRGVQLQINISSLTGYYSKPAQAMAYKLIDQGFVHWLGSDCHHLGHARLLEEAFRNKYFQKALTLPLLNNTIE
jgi:protein-tyrosine phosphatase